jgi:hypothetical protein
LAFAAPAHARIVQPGVSMDPPGLNPTVVSGVAGVSEDDARSVNVRFYRGAAVSGEAVSTTTVGVAPDGRFATAVGLLDDGQWTVQSEQFDLANHAALSPPVTFVVDHYGPRPEITAPAALTNERQPAILGTPGTEYGDLDAATVTVTGPNGFNVTVDAVSDRAGFRAELPSPLPDGHYTAVAHQADEFGHTGTASQAFEVDTVPPVVTLGGTGATFTGTASEGTTVHLTVQRGDGDAPPLGVTPPGGAAARGAAAAAGGVAARGAAVAAGGAAAPGTGWQVAVPVVDGAFATTLDLPDGDYTATATLYDAAGNAAFATRSFTLATPVPAAAPVVAPAPAAVPARRSAAALKITAARLSGRRLAVKGTAAKTATGVVTVTAGGAKRRVRLARGKWSATLRVHRPTKATARYGGDATHLPARATRRVTC